MKRLVSSFLVASTLTLSPSIRAEEVSENLDTEVQMEPGTPVGQASDEGARTAKRKQWQNIAIAAGAVAVAVTALVLVASNDGHH